MYKIIYRVHPKDTFKTYPKDGPAFQFYLARDAVQIADALYEAHCLRVYVQTDAGENVYSPPDGWLDNSHM